MSCRAAPGEIQKDLSSAHPYLRNGKIGALGCWQLPPGIIEPSSSCISGVHSRYILTRTALLRTSESAFGIVHGSYVHWTDHAAFWTEYPLAPVPVMAPLSAYKLS